MLQSTLRYLRTTMTSIPTVVFVLGAPGSGKGTQCDLIVQVGLHDTAAVTSFLIHPR